MSEQIDSTVRAARITALAAPFAIAADLVWGFACDTWKHGVRVAIQRTIDFLRRAASDLGEMAWDAWHNDDPLTRGSRKLADTPPSRRRHEDA